MLAYPHKLSYNEQSHRINITAPIKHLSDDIDNNIIESML